MRPAPVLRAAALALTIALAGCETKAPLPTAAVPPPPLPQVVTYPAARSERVSLDTGIYAEFDTDLDPASLTSTNVYFKIDESRYPVTLVWSAAERRLTVVPAQALQVGKTYTIEITPRVLRSSGEKLFPTGWFWQFSTTSIRPLRSPEPPDQSSGVSPFMRLRWDATEASAGQVVYRVFWGNDPVLVANRQSASGDAEGNRWIPKRRWATWPVYWAVRATNLRTGEVLEGPVWSFSPVPTGSPTVLSTVPALDWGWATSDQAPRCNGTSFTVAPGAVSAIRWQLPAPGVRLELADWTASIFPAVTAVMTLRATRQWNGCSMRYPGTPIAIGPALATGLRVTNGYLFQSDTLTAFVEAQARDGDLYGFVVESSRSATIVTNNPGDPTLGGMRIRSYPGTLFPETVNGGALRAIAGSRRR